MKIYSSSLPGEAGEGERSELYPANLVGGGSQSTISTLSGTIDNTCHYTKYRSKLTDSNTSKLSRVRH